MLTYKQLHREVCRFANVLKRNGIKRGDRISIYLPMIPEAAIAMLACTRIGAVHSVVFGGFSPESLINRIADCGSTLVITADEGLRGGRKVPLKANLDVALQDPSTACVQRNRTITLPDGSRTSASQTCVVRPACTARASHVIVPDRPHPPPPSSRP